MATCALCKREKLTKWYYENFEWVIFDCISCNMPMIVSKKHRTFVSGRNTAFIDAGAQMVAQFVFGENFAGFKKPPGQRMTHFYRHIYLKERIKKYLWKSMREGLSSFAFNRAEKKWKMNVWYDMGDTMGFWASVRIIDALAFISMENLALVEVRGKYLDAASDQCWEQMRIVKSWKWTKKNYVALLIYIAELILPDFMEKYPKDNRPRLSIQAAKKWLKNPTEENAHDSWRAGESAGETATEIIEGDQAAWATVLIAAWTGLWAGWPAARPDWLINWLTGWDNNWADSLRGWLPIWEASPGADQGIFDKIEKYIKGEIKKLEPIKGGE